MVGFWFSLFGILGIEQEALAEKPSRKEQIALTRCYPHPMFSEAFCGHYSVPEDRSISDGRKVEINIMMIPSVRANAQLDPIFVFAGGPGQGAVEVASSVMPSLLKMNQKRAIIFIDQRGTGKSNPLHCELRDTNIEEVPKEELKHCLTELEADTRMYQTQILAQDTAEIQQQLGFEKINIYGVSYGTRLGLSYLRQYPDLVRSAVLDGVAPLDIPIGSDHGLGARKALQALLLDCMADEPCRETFPELKKELEALELQLKEEERTIFYKDAKTFETQEIILSRDLLWSVLQQMLYEPMASSMIPFVIHQAYQNDWSSFMAWSQLGEETMSSIPIGLYLSVVCAEDVPRIKESVAFTDQLAGRTVSALKDMCSVWESGAVEKTFFAPVSSDIPMLLLSGEYDPVTPPSNGEQALKTLSNATHLVVPGAGHNTLRTECVLNIVREFIEEIDPKQIETSCVSQQKRPPFVISTAGTMP